MKVTIKKPSNQFKFSELVTGDCFIDSDGNVIMKTDEVFDRECMTGSYNSINLSTGKHIFTEENLLVRLAKSELIVE